MNRREAEELLPWFVAGTLSLDEAQAVQAFIDSGAISRSELDALGEFAEVVARTTPDEPAYDPSILDRAMHRLEEVAQEEAELPLVVREPVSAASSNWFSALIERLQWSATPPLARIAIAGQFALVMGLVVALASGTDDTAAPGYETVAASEVRGDLTLRFVEGATEQQIRELLLAADAVIVAGPSALGIYTLAINPKGDRPVSVARITDSALTEFVQPVPQP